MDYYNEDNHISQRYLKIMQLESRYKAITISMVIIAGVHVLCLNYIVGIMYFFNSLAFSILSIWLYNWFTY